LLIRVLEFIANKFHVMDESFISFMLIML
jgi:hypothetical protein